MRRFDGTPATEAAIRIEWETSSDSARAIAARYGMSKSTVAGIAARNGWKTRPRIPALGSGVLGGREDELRRLWEGSPLSAREIAVRMGVSKNVVSGLVSRRGWRSYNPARTPWRTMDERLDALNAKLDRVLAETAPASGHYLGCPAVRL